MGTFLRGTATESPPSSRYKNYDLKEPELRALRLAMNKLGEESSWVAEELSLEFRELLELDGPTAMNGRFETHSRNSVC